MKGRSRMWSLDAYAEAIELIIRKAASPDSKDLLTGTDPEERADAIIEKVFDEPSSGPLASITGEFYKTFVSEHWEQVLRAALEPLVSEAEVLHTGGPIEQGADVSPLIRPCVESRSLRLLPANGWANRLLPLIRLRWLQSQLLQYRT
jgi:hypothetical protein